MIFQTLYIWFWLTVRVAKTWTRSFYDHPNSTHFLILILLGDIGLIRDGMVDPGIDVLETLKSGAQDCGRGEKMPLWEACITNSSPAHLFYVGWQYMFVLTNLITIKFNQIMNYLRLSVLNNLFPELLNYFKMSMITNLFDHINYIYVSTMVYICTYHTYVTKLTQW